MMVTSSSRERNISCSDDPLDYHRCVESGVTWYREKLFIIVIITSILVILGLFLPPLYAFSIAFFDYISLVWWALLLGFLVGGVIDYLVPREYIERYLSQHKKRSIVYSIVLGFLMSACSHGILAIAMELYRKGANVSSVIAFLLASPWANLPITILLFGFFGLKAFLIVFAAIVIALVTGLIYLYFERRGFIECIHCAMGRHKMYNQEDFSLLLDIHKRIKNRSQSIVDILVGVLKGSWALTKMILWWLIIGMIMASLARAYIPHQLFMMYMGPTWIGMLFTLIFATIIEVCSEGSSPLAFEIFRRTGAFGNSFIFLMAGVATDYTEIGLIWHTIGRRSAVFLPIITVPQILVFAMIFNMFL